MTSSLSRFNSEISGPDRIVEALTLSALMVDNALAYTAEVIVGDGAPTCNELTAVHKPVPFCPALSKIISTNG